MRFFRRIFLPVFFVYAASAVLWAYSDPEYDPIVYKGTFFVLLEPAGPFEPEGYDEQKAMKQVLEEARFVFSAMIYGFSFEYTPMDSSRQVDEEFSVAPLHSIEWGDPALTATGGRYKDGRYDAELRYVVGENQLPWITSWQTNILPEISAAGTGDLYDGFDGKLTAIKNSVKEAARNYLRPRTYDKPRRISGKARLAAVPYISIDSGKFICNARVTLRIEEVLEYNAF